MTENMFAARIIFIPAAGMPTRFYELDSAEYATIEEAQEVALDTINGHDFANRIHIVKGVRDSYNGSVYAEVIEEHDVVRY
jgi:hypothetical protein